MAEAIEELNLVVWPAFDNIWVVQSEGSAVALRDLIGAKLANETVLLVALLAGHAAWQGFDPESEDWLLAYL